MKKWQPQIARIYIVHIPANMKNLKIIKWEEKPIVCLDCTNTWTLVRIYENGKYGKSSGSCEPFLKPTATAKKKEKELWKYIAICNAQEYYENDMIWYNNNKNSIQYTTIKQNHHIHAVSRSWTWIIAYIWNCLRISAQSM